MTNSPPQVAPLWGGEMLGTDPMAIAFPAREEPAVVIDLTTSACVRQAADAARLGAHPKGAPSTTPGE